MTSRFGDDCERCGAQVRQRGDHLCPACAEALGRGERQPFWGDFANHPDAMLRERPLDLAIDLTLAACAWKEPPRLRA